MFNKRLREMRMKRGFTQQNMADSINVALRSYQCYETGTRNPSFDLLIQIADTLNTSTDYILGRDDYLKSLGVSVDVSLECPPRRPTHQKNHQSRHTLSFDNVAD